MRQVWEEEKLDPVGLRGASELDQLPSGQPFAFEAQRPALAARGLSEAENELNAFVRAGHRVVVAFPHRGEALRTENLLRRVDAPMLDPGDVLNDDPQARFAVSPARRGFVWRDLNLVLLSGHAALPEACATARGRAHRSRAAVVRRPAHRRLRRARGPRHREAPRLRDEVGRRRHARLPAARVPRRGPPVRPARADRQGVALHRRRRVGARRSRSSAARPGRTSRIARAHPSASSPASCSRSTRSGSRRPARRTTSATTGCSGSSRSSPIARRLTRSARSRT